MSLYPQEGPFDWRYFNFILYIDQKIKGGLLKIQRIGSGSMMHGLKSIQMALDGSFLYFVAS
jgi:hypothetical protein